MTSPSSRRPRRTSRPDRAGVPRGRRSTRSGPPTTGPGRRTRTTTATTGTEPATAGSRFAGSRLTRQIAVLGMVLAVVALSLAYPLRTYLAQRADLAAAVERQHDLDQRIAELQIQQAALADPNFIAAEAKRRLQYVRPGDTVYVVQAPDLTPADATETAPTAPGGPWYATLWDTLSHPPGTAVDPGVLTPATTGPTG
ncbi:FtsB family cell division protein [Nakamurella deserti]|uniref:FtsB family cell division protein n=1 Tax=Nakamurella deserti TaxID=2164074 RepID=UPI000DBE6825|nr:septum formation initiator family protein [Nakamurella deserti]